nr:reverse transcriptase domain-containing protein [uncultured Methanospirillum sp.]
MDPAGGSISPLLGALYLKPLDDAFSHRDGILYRGFMDDVVVLAKTRWRLRRAIRLVHQILGELKMQVHKKKRFIGTTIQGFDFPLVYYPSFSETSPVR